MSHVIPSGTIARTLLLAGILLAITLLASQSLFPAFAQEGPKMVDEGVKDVTTFAATDEDGDDITWSKEETDDTASPDHDDFEISENGVLTFKNTPDYEMPTGEGDTRAESNTYTVVVIATDDGDPEAMTTKSVTVMVRNIDEPGSIELSTLQPQEGTPITATLTDPDEQRGSDDDADPRDTTISDDTTDPRPHTWQWARCSTADVATCVDIEENSTSTSYTATSTDRGHYLLVTAKYADKQTADPEGDEELQLDKTATAMSANPVLRANYMPEPPLFPGQAEDDIDDTGSFRTIVATTSRDIAENSPARTPVGAPVTATDKGADGSQETLTYTLGTGGDEGSYRIDRGTGQLTVASGVTLNHEDNPTDTVTVRATDPTDRYSEVTVTINITDVDEDPSITDRSASQTSITWVELTTDLGVGAPHAATDPEDDQDSDVSLIYSLTGADGNRLFDISDSGQVSFKNAPDFEAPADSGRNNVYNFNVVVTDSAGNTDSLPVTVTMSNSDEEGTLVVLFNGLTPDTPVQTARVGTIIRAKLTDPDGASNIRYEWQRGGTAIPGATSATYRPATTTGGALSVAVTYNDRLAQNITSVGPETLGAVDDRHANNDRPDIQAPSQALSVPENTPDTFTTTLTVDDDDDSVFSWAITGGRDRSLFSITQTSGELTLKSGVELDHETKPTLQVTLRATDQSASSDSITLNVTVTNFDEDPTLTGPDSPINYREDQTGPVATFTATDPEDDNERPSLPLSWEVDNAAFTIERGVLRFATQPDYDATGAVNAYTLAITVTDSDDDEGNIENFVVNVINVDEPGEVSLDALAPKKGVALRATLTDVDGTTSEPIASQQWTWSNSTSRTGPWATSTASGATTTTDVNFADYTPNDDDVGKYLRALVTYTDGQSNDVTPTAVKTAAFVSANTVRDADYLNIAPIFPGQDPDEPLVSDARPTNATTSREIAENSRAGTNVGAPVAAVDLGENRQQQVLTYAMADTTSGSDHSANFRLGRGTGQITVANDVTLDHETQPDGGYKVTVTAADPSVLMSSNEVTIMVTDVKESPKIDDATDTANLAATSTLENAATTSLSSYTATDDETDNASLKWSLSGADEAMFSLCVSEVTANDCGDVNADDSSSNMVYLWFKPSDYEKPSDSGRNNEYNVTITVTDDGTPKMTATRPVTVKVTNKDELGEVTLSHIQPEAGTSIIASVTDSDDGVSGVTWEWLWCEDPTCGTGTATSTINAVSRTYRPIAGDVGRYLKVKATYRDRTSSGAQDKRMASTTSTYAVQADDTTNQPPVLPDATQALKIPENSERMDPVYVVGTVAATADPDDDLEHLQYSLSGADAALFTIHSGEDGSEVSPATTTTHGMIRLKRGTTLDYETKNTYRVTVTATDPSLARDSVSVTIQVTDVNEAPEIMERGLSASGPANVSYPENGTAVVHTYRAVGPDASGARWSLSGADRDDFTLSAGALSFNTPPDYENPTDADTDRAYNVTIMVASGEFDHDLDVTVTVTNVDEDGTASISPATQPRVGVELTASLTDEDGTPTPVSWQWSRSTSNTGGWSDIPGATNAAYTPVEADVDNYLQATASYTDPQGPGKSESAVTSATVLAASTAGTEGTVSLSPSSGLVSGASVTATLTDADSPTNQVWVWERSANGSTNWSTISGAASASYTTTDADAGNFLRASVTYEDNSGTGQTAGPAVTTGRVAIDSYDGDANGMIDGQEVLAAVAAYFRGEIGGPRVLDVVALYFRGLND